MNEFGEDHPLRKRDWVVLVVLLPVFLLWSLFSPLPTWLRVAIALAAAVLLAVGVWLLFGA